MPRLLPALGLALLFAAGWLLGFNDQATSEPQPAPTSDSGASWDPNGG